MAHKQSAARLALYREREDIRRKRTRARAMAKIRKGYVTGRFTGRAGTK